MKQPKQKPTQKIESEEVNQRDIFAFWVTLWWLFYVIGFFNLKVTIFITIVYYWIVRWIK